ncbi:MAG: LysR family transcriptional regulator [Burkholderiaceae bacterium]
MNLRQLRTLVAVVEQGSIRGGARFLNLSQSAVTKAMQELEEEAGVALLVRRSRGVDLTEAGQRLLPRARLITREAELAREDLQQANGADSGTLRVGLIPYVSLTALGEAFHWFRQRYRQVRVEFSESVMARVLPRLRDGTLDLAVVAADAGELRGDDFRTQLLQRIPQRVVVRRGHPALAAPTAEELVRYEWIYSRHPLHERESRLAEMFGRAGVPPPSRYVVCDALQIFSLQRRNDCVSIMPELMLGKPETRDIVGVPGTAIQPFDLELTMLRRADTPLTPAAAYFAHCLVETLRTELSPVSDEAGKD